jgi:hypothetical protein
MEDRPGLRPRLREAPPLNSAGKGRRGLEELRQMAREGTDPVPVLEEAFRVVFDASPRFSHRRWAAVLRTAVKRGDRWRRPGGRIRGAAVSWVIDRMVEEHELGSRPHSLAFYADRLDRESQDWRREREAVAA